MKPLLASTPVLLLTLFLALSLAGCVDPATGQPVPPLFAPPSGEPVVLSTSAAPTPVPTSAPTETPTQTPAPSPTATLTVTLPITPSLTVTAPVEITATVEITVALEVTATLEISPTAELAEEPLGPPRLAILTQRGNIRGGPGMQNPVVATGQRGDSFDIIARSEDGEWWQICCVAGGQRAWIADSIVEATGAIGDVPVSGPLFPADLTATWQVDYVCDSDRCAVAACSGTMSAVGRQFVRTTFLEIDRRVEWGASCGENSYWLHQVDNFTGLERYALAPDTPLFHYWIGALPGPATDTVILADGRTVNVLCAGPFTQENAEGDGWTSVYTGGTCHDVRTGMIVTMHYAKQWLFTGEFEGKTYSREFFGDQESYHLTLSETNAELAEK